MCRSWGLLLECTLRDKKRMAREGYVEERGRKGRYDERGKKTGTKGPYSILFAYPF